MSKGCSFFKSLHSTLPAHRRTFRHTGKSKNSPKMKCLAPFSKCLQERSRQRLPHVLSLHALCVGWGRGRWECWSGLKGLFSPACTGDTVVVFSFLHTRINCPKQSRGELWDRGGVLSPLFTFLAMHRSLPASEESDKSRLFLTRGINLS